MPKTVGDDRPSITTTPETADRDRLFSEQRRRVDDFDFGAKTANVFDDMLDRSVPFYQEIQRMVAELAVDFAEDGTSIYDLGCSTGTSFVQIAAGLPAGVRVKFVGLDSSKEMLEKAERKLKDHAFGHDYELRHTDLNAGVSIENASVVLLVLTLQFVRPLQRERIIRSVYEGLTENGCLILVEKVLGESSDFNRLFINHYYEIEAAQRVQRSRDRPEARSARKRAGALPARRKQGTLATARIPERRRVLQVVQLLRDHREEMKTTSGTHATGVEPGGTAVPEATTRRSLLVSIGHVLFHYRNALFPVTFLLLALASRPMLLGGDLRTDAILDVVGIAIALAGQGLRAAVIGLAYIRRGGKEGRIHADTLVTEGFFAHSRNPLYLGNMLVYLGLFLVLNSVLGYAVGVPFFLFAYICITRAEEDYLRSNFGATYEEYFRRVPRFLPKLEGLGATTRGMRFDWKRLLRKEYGSTFSWMTTMLALLYWERVRNQGVAASQGALGAVLVAWAVLFAGYLVVRYLKKSKALQD